MVPLQLTSMVLVPVKYAPMSKSTKPTSKEQQSMDTVVFVSFPWRAEMRKSPDPNSSMLTMSPLSSWFPRTQVLGRETIMVEPPVS